MKLYYGVVDHNQLTFDPLWSNEFDDNSKNSSKKDFVERLAEYHFNNCDGWECEWPLTFRLWNEAGEFVGDYEVYIENEPHFYSSPVKNYSNTVHETRGEV